MSDDTIFCAKGNNKNLTSNTLSLGHLRIYLNMTFPSLRQAGQKAGISYERIRQLVTGKYLPSKPELIKQLSEAWGLDPIKLTQLFERMRNKNIQNGSATEHKQLNQMGQKNGTKI